MAYSKYLETLVKEGLENSKGISTLYSKGVINILKNAKEPRDKLMEYVKGRKIIDIGCGMKNSAEEYALFLINELGASSYCGVDPFMDKEDISKHAESKIKYVKKDALAYLLEQPDESAVITANGVLNEEIISHKEYMEKLKEEIYRITPKNGIFFGAHIDNPKSFEKYGFKHILGSNSLPINILKK